MARIGMAAGSESAEGAKCNSLGQRRRLMVPKKQLWRSEINLRNKWRYFAALRLDESFCGGSWAFGPGYYILRLRRCGWNWHWYNDPRKHTHAKPTVRTQHV